MIDTVRLMCKLRRMPELDPMIWNGKTEQTLTSKVLHWESGYEGIDFRLHGEPNQAPNLFGTMHLPKRLFGHNIGILTSEEINRALDYFHESVQTLPGIEFELAPLDEWIVTRLDYGYVWRVGAPNDYIRDIGQFLNARSTSDIVKYESQPTQGATVSVVQRSLSAKFYNKESHVNLRTQQYWGTGYTQQIALLSEEFANGVLRFEITNDNDRIKRTILKNDRTVKGLRQFVDTELENAVRADLHKVARNYAPSEKLDARTRIFDHYKQVTTARALFKFWATVQHVGKEFYLEMAPDKTEFQSRVRDLEKCGVGFGIKTKPLFRLDIPSDKVAFCHDLAFYHPDQSKEEFELRTHMKIDDPRVKDLSDFVTSSAPF